MRVENFYIESVALERNDFKKDSHYVTYLAERIAARAESIHRIANMYRLTDGLVQLNAKKKIELATEYIHTLYNEYPVSPSIEALRDALIKLRDRLEE